MENGPVEIVDFPINSMVDLSMAKCDSSPEGNSHEVTTYQTGGLFFVQPPN